jgi:hypothetical protein
MAKIDVVSEKIESRNKALVLEAFDTLFNRRNYSADLLLARLKSEWSKSFLRPHELTYQSRNFVRCRVQCEMTTIYNVDFSIGHISPVGFRFRGVKR